MVLGILAILIAIGMLIAFFAGAGPAALIICAVMGLVGAYLLMKNLVINPGKEKVISSFPCVHMSGLPLGENEMRATALENRLIFKSGSSTFELNYDKITAADLREKSELSGSSAGSVVAGAVLFGALGAVIAARPKNKKEYILAISYISDGVNKTIAVAVPYESGYLADKAVDKMRKNIIISQNVVL